MWWSNSWSNFASHGSICSSYHFSSWYRYIDNHACGGNYSIDQQQRGEACLLSKKRSKINLLTMCTVIEFILYIILLMYKSQRKGFVSPGSWNSLWLPACSREGNDVARRIRYLGSKKRGFIFNFVYETKKICQGFLWFNAYHERKKKWKKFP